MPQGQQNVLQWSQYRSRSSERWCLTSLLPHSPVGDESSSRQKHSQDYWLTYLHHWLISKDRFAAPVQRGWDQTGTSKLAPDSQDQKDGHPNWDQSKPGITVSYLLPEALTQPLLAKTFKFGREKKPIGLKYVWFCYEFPFRFVQITNWKVTMCCLLLLLHWENHGKIPN